MQRCAASGTRLSSLPDHRFTTSGPSLCTGKQIRSICAHAAGAEPGRGRVAEAGGRAFPRARTEPDSARFRAPGHARLECAPGHARGHKAGEKNASEAPRACLRARKHRGPASPRAEPHPCAGACSTGPEGRFFSPARPPSMPLRTALPSMPPCTEPAPFQAKPCVEACSKRTGGRPRKIRTISSP